MVKKLYFLVLTLSLALMAPASHAAGKFKRSVGKLRTLPSAKKFMGCQRLMVKK